MTSLKSFTIEESPKKKGLFSFLEVIQVTNMRVKIQTMLGDIIVL